MREDEEPQTRFSDFNDNATNQKNRDADNTEKQINESITIESESFDSYWYKQIATRNEEENHPERNDPSHSWPIGRFEPHKLGSCKRQWMYHWLNAPQEDPDPHGIFAIGHFMEEEIIEPWLVNEFEPELTVNNAIHVSTIVEEINIEDNQPDPPVETGITVDVPDDIPINTNTQKQTQNSNSKVHLTISGSTDPAICDSETDEVLCLTEVKTTKNIDQLNGEPKDKHLYQIHAYMKALDITDGFIIYVDRNKLLSPTVFEVEFSEEIWQTIKSWVKETFKYAISNTLPPANPPKEHMCKYCTFRNRCGEGRSNLVNDMGVVGFVPGYKDYPKNAVVEHLEAHDDVKLTPTLAMIYPDLAEKHEVEKWKCPNCTAEFNYTEDHFDGFKNTQFETPICPACESVFDKEIYLQTESSITQTENN